MSTPVDLIDAETGVMTSGRIADAGTAHGYGDLGLEWCGAVSAYVSNNSVPASDLPALIDQVHTALTRVSGAGS